MIDISCIYGHAVNEIASPNSKVRKPLTWEEKSWNQSFLNYAQTKSTVLDVSYRHISDVYLVF
jgi:hypothetical protein